MMFLAKLASAIATQEGWFDKKGIGPRINNPGNIRPWWGRHLTPPLGYGIYDLTKKDGPDNRYISYPTISSGIAGLYCDLMIKIRSNMTIPQIIRVWAPAADGNKPDIYIRNVFKFIGIPDTPENRNRPAASFLELEDPRK